MKIGRRDASPAGSAGATTLVESLKAVAKKNAATRRVHGNARVTRRKDGERTRAVPHHQGPIDFFAEQSVAVATLCGGLFKIAPHPVKKRETSARAPGDGVAALNRSAVNN